MSNDNNIIIKKLSEGAHQIKSPINSLYTLLDVILYTYKEQLPDNVKKLLYSALEKTNDIKKITEDILKLSRIEKKFLKLESINLEKFISEMNLKLYSLARQKKVELNFNISESLPFIKSDQSLLYNIFFNIIENAINYTPSGGMVNVNLEIDSTENLLKLKVKDTGIGIPEQYINEIFNEFFRAPNAKVEKKSGTGLGLAIVKKSVELLNGKIDVSSKVGEGTLFKVNIPVEILKEEKTEKKKKERIVIIGGGAAGPKSAAKLRRMNNDCEIILIEKGEFLSYSGCGLPYYIAGLVENKHELMSSPSGELRDPDFFKRIGNIIVHNYTEALKIDRKNKRVTIKSYKTGRIEELQYDYLILATGGKPKTLNIEGAGLKNIFTLHSFEDADRLKAILAPPKAKEGVIVGAGLIGMELAESLISRGTRVTVIEKEKNILPLFDEDIAQLIKNQLELKGVKFLTDEIVTRFEGDEYVRYVITNKRKIPVEFVIISIGILPEVTLAKECGLQIGQTGAIKVNQYLQTSDPYIYAVGDCAENLDLVSNNYVFMPLGSTANKHGRTAALNIAGCESKFSGIVKTVVFKVFDISVGKTGLTTKEAIEAGYKPLSVLVPSLDREHYYYDKAQKIIIKIIGDEETGKLLGTQIFGTGDVVRRIDVAATALFNNMKISQLKDLDLAYMPAFGLPFDPIIVAANVWENYRNKIYEKIEAHQLYEILKSHQNVTLIDVRTPKEFEHYSIIKSINIPLGVLRGYIDSIPKDKQVILICDTGLRSYQAYLILKRYDFKNIKILDGGISCWPYIDAEF